MPEGHAICPVFLPIEHIFNPAIPKWPGKLQVLWAFLSKTKTFFVVGRPQRFIVKFHRKIYLLITIYSYLMAIYFGNLLILFIIVYLDLTVQVIHNKELNNMEQTNPKLIQGKWLCCCSLTFGILPFEM